jgi:hypothetical protein
VGAAEDVLLVLVLDMTERLLDRAEEREVGVEEFDEDKLVEASVPVELLMVDKDVSVVLDEDSEDEGEKLVLDCVELEDRSVEEEVLNDERSDIEEFEPVTNEELDDKVDDEEFAETSVDEVVITEAELEDSDVEMEICVEEPLDEEAATPN